MDSESVVDIERLRMLTISAPQSGSFKSSVDFSEFASNNFEKTVAITHSPKKGSSRRHSKWVYNEVQRNSINFGISAEDMIAYHNQKKHQTHESIQNSPRFSSPNNASSSTQPPSKASPAAQSRKSWDSFEEKSAMKNFIISPKRDSQLSTGGFLQSISRFTPPPRPKTRPPDLNISTSGGLGFSSLNKISPTVIPLDLKRRNSQLPEPAPFRGQLQESNPLKKSSSFEALRRKSSTSSKDINFKYNTTDLKAKIFPTNPQRRSSQLSLKTFQRPKSESNVTPAQRECHSVEETLLADEDFNDFTIPSIKSRPTSALFGKANEFDFEKPLSRPPSLRDCHTPESNRDSMAQSNSPTTGLNSRILNTQVTPTQLRKRESAPNIEGPEIFEYKTPPTPSSPGFKSTRSFSANDTSNLSPVRFSPRMSSRASMSDLKGSPIQRISEHEVSHFGSPQPDKRASKEDMALQSKVRLLR